MDLAILSKPHSKATENTTTGFSKMIKKVKDRIEEGNKKYIHKENKHRRMEIFKEGDLVMIRI